MTWQRIDENTYMDDTLVTCVEYQLFIDEMLEQGKHYQPDHWTSHQFPAGQAREPILGIRHLDAVIFCEWLKKRDTSEWEYRLPIKEEADIYPIKAIENKPLGFWVDGDYQFVWAGATPKDARSLNLIRAIELVNNHVLDVKEERDLARFFSRDGAPTLGLVSASHRARVLDLASASDRVRNRTLDLDNTRDLDRARAYIRDSDHDRALASNLTFAITTASEHVRASFYASDSGFTIAGVSSSPLEHDLDLTLECALDCAFSLTHDQPTFHDLNLVLDIFFDMYTLQERIAGRSPAFEGIRLVKERTK